MPRRRLPPSRRSPVAAGAAKAVAGAAAPAPEALPAETADERARRDRAQALARAVTAAPGATPSPSMQQATAHPVDPKAYPVREQRAAARAMDWGGQARNALSFLENAGWPGFPTLALLSQLAEYRSMHETLADECVRCWGVVSSSGDGDDDVCSQIEAELKRLNIRAAVRQMVVHDQAFGGAHGYIKLKGDETVRETPLLLRPYSVRRNSFEGLRVVEPYWVTPNDYNSIDPTKANFYKPSSWWLLGTETHATRLFTLVSRPVADMLKPTYSFRGISMTQLAIPYVDNWLRTRQSVSDTVKQFSVSGVLMDLQQSLLPGADTSLDYRAQLLNLYRDNRNLLLLDKATEEFFQINTPLSGLDALQAQAQEQMSAVSHTPLVKLLGLTPSGLNASSEGEIRVWYDYVRGYQDANLTPLMHVVLQLVQLSLFGVIDEDITWQWEKLHEATEVEQAEIERIQMETARGYIEVGVISPEQEAQRLSADPTSMYSGIADGTDLAAIPDDDIPAITEAILGIEAPVADPATPPLPAGAGLPPSAQAGVALPAEDASFSFDAEWQEGDHPRAKNGQFGSGGAQGASKKASLTAAEKSAVSSYSGDNFLRLNTALRSGDASDPDVARLDSAIGKGQIASGTILYRGMTREAALQLFKDGQIDKGAEVSDKAFLSTSSDINEAGARAIGGVMLKIETGASATGLDVGAVSRNPNEKEVLLPRGAKMIVEGVTPPKKVGQPIVVRVRYG